MPVKQHTLDVAKQILRDYDSFMPHMRWGGDEWVVTTGYKDFAHRLGVSMETARFSVRELDSHGDIVLLRGTPFRYRFPE